jgi:hypothetical protein
MTVGLLIAATLVAAVEVDAPLGCVSHVELEVALNEIGGLDPAEQVAVRVMRQPSMIPTGEAVVPVPPADDAYLLTLDIALLQAPSLHREVRLWPTECRDVADLVAVLVQQQRRASLKQRLVDFENTSNDGDPAPSTTRVVPRNRSLGSTPLLDPSQQRQTELLEDTWRPCDGPIRCGGWRSSASYGAAFGLGQRAAADTGFDVSAATVLVQGSVVGTFADPSRGELRGDISIGAAWRTKLLQHVELSTRGLLGVGGTTGGVRPAANSVAPCVVDDTGAPVTASPGEHVTSATWFLAPAIALRARFGYVFLEAGSFWHVRIDAAPVTYLAIGVAPLGG